MKKNKVKYGIKNVHYALETVAEDGSINYEKPEAWPGAVSLTLSATGEPSDFYADNMLFYRAPGAGGYEGDLETALIPDDFLVNVLGDRKDSAGGIIEDALPSTKNFALLFQFEGDTKATRHCLYHCNASRPELAGNTVETTATPETETLSFTASARPDNGWVKYRSTPEMADEIYNKWFDTVPEPVSEEQGE